MRLSVRLALAALACAAAYVPNVRMPIYSTRTSLNVAMGPGNVATKGTKMAKVALTRTLFWTKDQGRNGVLAAEEKPPPTFSLPSSLPSFKLPEGLSKIQGSQIQGAAVEEPSATANPTATSFSLSSLPKLPFPSFGGSGAAADQVVEAVILDPEPLPPKAEPPSLLGQLSEAIKGALMTVLKLALASLQLAIVRQIRRAEVAVEQAKEEAIAAPEKAKEAARRLAYRAPFYAKAMTEIARDDALKAFERAQSEAERAVQAMVAAPDQLAQSIASSVKSELVSAQAEIDATLAQAKSQAKSARDQLP